MSTQTTKTDNTSKASSMAELMGRAKSPVVTFNKSDIVKGVITKLTPSEILVDINAKTEAIVLEKDKRLLRNLLKTLKVGDAVNVSILNPESDYGNSVVSLRRFIDDIAWEKLKKAQQSQEKIEVIVREVARAGFMVETDFGISGFLPHSQTTLVENQQELLNKTITVYVLELNRVDKKIIFSQRPTLTTADFSKIVAGIKVGQKVNVVISTITSFGLFVALPKTKNGENIEGLIHISEIAWERTEDIESGFSVGQAIEAVVIRLDWEAKRVDLSLKRMTVDPMEEVLKKYTLEQKVTGIVTKVGESGVSLKVGEKEEEIVEGIIRKEKIPVATTYEVGQKITATINEVDTKRRRLMLSPVLKEKPIGYR